MNKGDPNQQFDARIDAAMDRCAEGDDDAFAEVYQLMGPRVMSFLIGQGASKDLAQDLVQEVAVRLYRARGNFNTGASAMAWAYSIARNAYIDHRRSAHVKRIVYQTDDSTELSDGVDHVSPHEHLETTERATHLRRALDQVPDEQRKAYTLFHEQNLSVSDGAKKMGISPNAFKIRVHRVKQTLRAAMHAFDHDD